MSFFIAVLCVFPYIQFTCSHFCYLAVVVAQLTARMLRIPNDPGSNPCNRQLLILFMNSNKLKDENMNIKKLGIPIKTRFDPFRRQQTPTHQAFVYFRGNDGFEFRQLKISRQF